MEKKKQELAPSEFEKLPAEVRANMLSSESSIFFNVALFEQAQRVAKMFADSTMVPDHFRGNIGNCMIGLNYAMRLQADPFMVIQCLYVVHGRPGIEGKLVEAVINQSNKYSEPLEYEWLDPADNLVSRQEVLKAAIPSDYGCQAFTIEKKGGKRVTGPKITWQLIKAKGWYDKKGPDGTIESNNWRVMPEMMFYYRTAAWFGNKNCPELTLGMYTVEELEEIVDLRQRANGSYAATDLTEKLKTAAQPETKDETKEDLYATKKPEPEKKEETEEEKEDPIAALFENLGKREFKKFLESHKTAIPTMSQKHQDMIKAKFQGFWPSKSYTIDEEPKTPTGTDPNMTADRLDDEPKDETEHEKILRLVDGAVIDEGMDQPVVPCPQRKNNKVASNWCHRNCETREKCDTWVEYDKE